MDTVILAFESEKTMFRIREIIENSGLAFCLTCHTGAEVKRLVFNQQINTVVCGYKLRDETAEALFDDLPESCNMLVIAIQSLAGMVNNIGITRLIAPVSHSDLLASVSMLLLAGQQSGRSNRTARDLAVLKRAKRLLMLRSGITEDQAHRYLLQRSMESGEKALQIAKQLLAEAE